jgi:hypothetical protein
LKGGGGGGSETSWIQVTSCPLNSRRSSFSTAVFRSAAVSYSTNLRDGLVRVPCRIAIHLPRAVAFATNFRVDDVQSRLAGKIFKVL